MEQKEAADSEESPTRFYGNCRAWVGSGFDDDAGYNGSLDKTTYITDLPLPSVEPDYESEEYQTELRKKWADDPSIPLEYWNSIGGWTPWCTGNIKGWTTDHTFREAKPKSQEEIDLLELDSWTQSGEVLNLQSAWLAACKYARGEK